MIKVEEYIPETHGNLALLLNNLKLGESILIAGEDLTDKTRQHVYTAASRLRLSVRTHLTPVGLRVWLNAPRIEPVRAVSRPPGVLNTEEEKQAKLDALRGLMGGVKPVSPGASTGPRFEVSDEPWTALPHTLTFQSDTGGWAVKVVQGKRYQVVACNEHGVPLIDPNAPVSPKPLTWESMIDKVKDASQYEDIPST